MLHFFLVALILFQEEKAPHLSQKGTKVKEKLDIFVKVLKTSLEMLVLKDPTLFEAMEMKLSFHETVATLNQL